MLFKTVAAVALTIASVGAHAAVVPFLENPSTGWLDGTMTHNLSEYYDDGFYNTGDGPTKAFNGYGQNGLSILFDTDVTLDSLTLGNCYRCSVSAAPTAKTLTVTLFGGRGGLLASQTIVPTDAMSLLTFGTPGVRTATFTFTGGVYDYFADRRTVAFYSLVDVKYSSKTDLGDPVETPVSSIPDAATWLMMIAGFGLVGSGMRRHRTAHPA